VQVNIKGSLPFHRDIVAPCVPASDDERGVQRGSNYRILKDLQLSVLLGYVLVQVWEGDKKGQKSEIDNSPITNPDGTMEENG